MGKTTEIRAMRAEDLAAVLEIQSCCYDAAKLESRESFLAKLEASPATCFIAVVAGVQVGYLVAIPAEEGRPPSLNEPTYVRPRAANALYLHDLAVHPSARGAGAAAALVAAYFHTLRRSQARFGCLTAVNQSSAYWERHGFRSTSVADVKAGCMATYGEGAQYMRVQVSVRGSSGSR